MMIQSERKSRKGRKEKVSVTEAVRYTKSFLEGATILAARHGIKTPEEKGNM